MLLASTLESATFIAIFSDFPKNQSSVQDQDRQPLKNVRMIKQQLCRVGGVGEEGEVYLLPKGSDHRYRK